MIHFSVDTVSAEARRRDGVLEFLVLEQACLEFIVQGQAKGNLKQAKLEYIHSYVVYIIFSVTAVSNWPFEACFSKLQS